MRELDQKALEAAKWEIDYSAGSPILTYEKCSVIQDKQAHYIMRLLRQDAALPSAPAVEGVERELVERLSKHGCKWTVGDDESEQRARDCDLAASAISRLVKERDEARGRILAAFNAFGKPGDTRGRAFTLDDIDDLPSWADGDLDEQIRHLETEVARLTALLAEADEDAARDVLAERARQKSVEGWTVEHDDKHNGGQLALAAATYAYAAGLPDDRRAGISGGERVQNNAVADELWPFGFSWWKPSDRRRDLVKAGALIVAEIERLDRASRRYQQKRAAK